MHLWTAAVLAFVLAAPAGVGPGTIEGRWELVEQHYGAGGNDLRIPDLALTLEFRREGTDLSGRIWAGADAAAARTWPAFASDAGPLPVTILERGPDRPGAVRVRYAVRPSAEDDLVLEVTEAYAVSADGGTLVGTMDVRFTGGTTQRGGFTLHRVYRRVR